MFTQLHTSIYFLVYYFKFCLVYQRIKFHFPCKRCVLFKAFACSKCGIYLYAQSVKYLPIYQSAILVFIFIIFATSTATSEFINKVGQWQSFYWFFKLYWKSNFRFTMASLLNAKSVLHTKVLSWFISNQWVDATVVGGFHPMVIASSCPVVSTFVWHEFLLIWS